VKTILQGCVSSLRKVLGPETILTRGPGYVVEVAAGELDLHRFEQLLAEGRESAARADHAAASRKLREALGLWRGPALADFAYEPFAESAIVRLDELRLTALEDRIDADLALGRHGELVGELEALVAERPLREHLRKQLMLALYRSGRQAEALDAYRRARSVLVEELGIDPSPALQELEKAILRQDPALALATEPASALTSARERAAPVRPERAILVVARGATALDLLLALAQPLARRPPRELILAALVPEDRELVTASAFLQERRGALLGAGTAARVAAFTSAEPGGDTVRLASEQNVDLLLFDATAELMGGSLGLDLAAVLAGVPCDIAVLVAPGERVPDPGPDRPVLVPFGGAEHEWAAAEVGAWLAGAVGAPLRLLGTAADKDAGRRDASRLLATASLIVQQVAGVAADPLLVEPGPQAVIDVAADAGLLVLGLSDRWRQEGIGGARLAVTRGSPAPTLLVRGGLRPGGLAPRESLTRFTWTIAGADR
jgi:DNA-binding SARP family transcriptional activator